MRPGIDRSVCFGWPFADPEHCAEVNDHLIAVQRDHPDRLTCFATVSAGATGRRRRAATLRGRRACAAPASSTRMRRVSSSSRRRSTRWPSACTDLGIPLVLHCSEPVGHDYPGKGTATPGRVAAFALRHPELQLVCAHLGGGLPVLRAHARGGRAVPPALVRHRGGPVPLRPDGVPRGGRPLRCRSAALRLGPSAASRATLHRCVCAGGVHRLPSATS